MELLIELLGELTPSLICLLMRWMVHNDIHKPTTRDTVSVGLVLGSALAYQLLLMQLVLEPDFSPQTH